MTNSIDVIVKIKQFWHDFNYWIDPKFGVHIVWMIPVFYIVLVVDYIAEKLYNAFKRFKNLFQKRYIKDLKNFLELNDEH